MKKCLKILTNVLQKCILKDYLESLIFCKDIQHKAYIRFPLWSILYFYTILNQVCNIKSPSKGWHIDYCLHEFCNAVLLPLFDFYHHLLFNISSIKACIHRVTWNVFFLQMAFSILDMFEVCFRKRNDVLLYKDVLIMPNREEQDG